MAATDPLGLYGTGAEPALSAGCFGGGDVTGRTSTFRSGSTNGRRGKLLSRDRSPYRDSVWLTCYQVAWDSFRNSRLWCFSSRWAARCWTECGALDGTRDLAQSRGHPQWRGLGYWMRRCHARGALVIAVIAGRPAWPNACGRCSADQGRRRCSSDLHCSCTPPAGARDRGSRARPMRHGAIATAQSWVLPIVWHGALPEHAAGRGRRRSHDMLSGYALNACWVVDLDRAVGVCRTRARVVLRAFTAPVRILRSHASSKWASRSQTCRRIHRHRADDVGLLAVPARHIPCHVGFCRGMDGAHVLRLERAGA